MPLIVAFAVAFGAAKARVIGSATGGGGAPAASWSIAGAASCVIVVALGATRLSASLAGAIGCAATLALACSCCNAAAAVTGGCPSIRCDVAV